LRCVQSHLNIHRIQVGIDKCRHFKTPLIVSQLGLIAVHVGLPVAAGLINRRYSSYRCGL
jgi:hypothetical protein